MSGFLVQVDRAEILEWRERERKVLCDRIEQRLPELEALITEQADEMTMWNVVWRSSFHDEQVAPKVEEWLRALYDELRSDIEDSAIESERLINPGDTDQAWSWGEIAAAGAAAAVSVAPLAALPFVAGIATVTTTSFFVFSTSVVSIPVLTAVVGGLAVSGYGGHKIREKTFDYFVGNYRKQTVLEARAKVIGETGADDEDTLQNRLLNEIDLIAISRLEHHK